MDANQPAQPTSDAHTLLIIEPGAEARERMAALFVGDAYVLHQTVEECQHAFDDLRDILTRLQRIVIYRTEPYLDAKPEDPPSSGRQILSV